MASEIKYAVQQFAWPTTTGTFDVTIPSLGWTPKACRVMALGTGSNGTALSGVVTSIGFCDGTNQGGVAVSDLDNQASIVSDRAQSSARIIYSNATSILQLDMLAGTAGPISDGWKIDCINARATPRLCIIEFFGGADLSAEVGTFTPATTGNTSKTGMGFQPNLLHMIGVGNNTYALANNSCLSSGFAYDGTAVEQGSIISQSGINGDTTQKATAKLSTASIAGQMFNEAETWRGSISSFNSDGWTFSVDAGATGGADDVHYLALDIGDRKATVKEVDAPTSAASDWAITGIGFEPQGLSLIPSMMEAADVDTLKTDQKAGYIAFGVADGTRQYSHSTTVEDAAGTSNISRVSHARTAYMLDTADAALFDVGLPTFNSDGWTVASADINTAQATQRKWLAIAIEREGGTLSVTCGLVDINGVSLQNLTSLDWSWFDSTDPSTFTTPVDQGAVETTDATGEIAVDLPNTTLTSGQSGSLVLSDGVALAMYQLSVS